MSPLRARSARLLLAAISLGATVAACVSEDDLPEDAADASFLGADGKEDAFGVADPSYEAFAILQVVNHASRQRLREDLGIGPMLVDRIVAARPFTSLVALDAVPYTGAVFFGRLLRHVRERGLVGRCGDIEPQITPGGPEECDIAATDGSEIGCGPTCRYEAAPGCGDGVVDAASEACDDGNLAPLDGCSSSCQWEILDADVLGPTSTFKHFIKTARADLVSSGAPISITVQFDLAQVTQFGVDVAAFHTLAWGPTAADFAAFKTALASHEGVETHPRLGGSEYVSATVQAYPGAHVTTPDVDEAANVSVLTPANSAWDATVTLPIGRSYVMIQVANWAYTQDSWAGMSALLVPLGTLGPVCGDGVKSPQETCDDGNLTSGDGCNATCSAIETYVERSSSTNMRASGAENAGFHRIISGVLSRLWDDVDVDHYKVTVAQPTTVSLVHKIFDGSPEVGCTNFDGLLQRVAADNSVLETSPDAADGCARLTLAAGTHILRVTEVTRSLYSEPYLLQMQ